jgi:hypothetical protein
MKNYLDRLGVILNRHDFLYPIVSVTFAILIVLKLLYSEDMQSVGNDIMLHINPIWLLLKQWEEGVQWPLWGSWDPYRYCGFPFLTAYAPLFYYCASFLSLLFSLSVSEAVKWLVILAFSCSAITMYYCSKSIIGDSFASMISSLAYVLVPLRLTHIIVVGNPTYSLAFLFLPLVFLFTDKLLKGSKIRFESLTLASLSVSAVILSHHGLGFSLVFFLFVFFALKWLFAKKINRVCLFIVPLAIAVSAFFTVPMITYYLKYPFISYPLCFPPSPPLYIVFGALFLSYGWTPIGATAAAFGIVAPLLIKKNNEFKVYLSLALIILGTYICSASSSLILPIGVIGGRAQWLLAFFLSLLIGFYLATIKRYFSKLKVCLIVTIIVTLMLFEALLVRVYYPPSATRYTEAYEYVRNDPEDLGTLRVWQVPRGHLVAALPIYTGRGTIDGVTFGPKEIDYFIFKSIANAGGNGLIGYGWGDLINDADKALRVLRILGVKYVIVDSQEPVYPLNISKMIYLNLKRSELVEEEANFTDPRYPMTPEHIHVFKLKDWLPLITTPKAFIINNENEVVAYYEIVSRKDFDPKTAIFLSRENDLKDIPHACWNGNLTNEGNVNLKLRRLEQFATRMEITVDVDKQCFLYVPVTYYNPGFKFVVNGQKAEPLKALPNSIALYLPSKGTYTIFISRELSLLEITSLTLSFITLGLLVFFIVIEHLKHPRETLKRACKVFRFNKKSVITTPNGKTTSFYILIIICRNKFF